MAPVVGVAVGSGLLLPNEDIFPKSFGEDGRPDPVALLNFLQRRQVRSGLDRVAQHTGTRS